ncbi:twitch domain-containing radical SAM protein [Candidatus Woesearchaeota archaeon]|jgi:radical SAM protein with 4Fe4S-binding SPASM domain|nr:twitch domain-containing radical SAM protein [Candidatus Woesearchaeota archaeon]MBT7558345.1 twitch domain-containing radical SAM protein [Candidatus Woesearchaeota archaeon]
MSKEKKNKSFCMAPWVHMSIWQTGDAYPCCIYDWETPIGNVNDEGFRGVWNNDSMKELRLKMLNGDVVDSCKTCDLYDEQGIYSYRHKMNTEYKHHQGVVDSTEKDGYVEQFNLAYFDVRFSNLCNMKCRTCGSHFSSKWGEDDYNGKPIVIEIDYPNMWKEIEEVIPTIEEIYFTGGESLFMPHHYKLLDMLIERDKKPLIKYNSNASRLGIGDKHIKNYWPHFEEIIYGVSFDQVGDKASYTRHGTKWDKIVENLFWIRDNNKNVVIEPSPTISIFNILDLDKIVEFLFENDLSTNFRINLSNLLVTPEYFSITLLPKELKVKAEKNINKLKKYIIKKVEHIGQRQHIIENLDKVIRFMYGKDTSDLIPRTLNEIKLIDIKRKENFFEVFPEYEILKEYEK